MEKLDHNITTFGIRNRILIFALIVTFIPSVGLGWAFYTQTKKLLQEKVEQEFHNVINHAQREAELWIKENTVNARVFSNSFVISENLERFLNVKQRKDIAATKEISAITEIMNEYLMLVQSQFQEYQRLLLLDASGEIIAQSTESKKEFTLPADWKDQLAQHRMIIGENGGNETSVNATFFIATPVYSPHQTVLGLLVTESGVQGLKSVMKSVSLSRSTNLSLLFKDGSILDSSTQINQKETAGHLDKESFTKLYDSPMNLSTYTCAHGIKVVGVFAHLPYLSWGVLMEKKYDLAFAEVLELKNITLVIIATLLTFIGFSAFFLSYSILSPLKQLLTGAKRVAEGDLDVKLPVKNRDEIGFTTSVFNDMVIQLRKNHDKLEKLATVDSLTGLYNRKHLMDTLSLHVQRYDRHQTPFSILMADLDYFKKVNDCYGHLGGDAVLVRVGKIFEETLRSIDTAGRYGGEEFLIVLDNAMEEEAKQTAERIRKAVEDSTIIMDGKTIKVTISIGIATISDTISTDNGQLIGMADKALYEAKQKGRNCVVLFT